MTAIDTTVQVDMAREILSFDGPATDLYNVIEGAYASAIRKKWMLLLDRLKRQKPTVYEDWQQKIAALSPEGFHVSFLKPDFTDKLLNYEPQYLDYQVAVLGEYLDAERAKLSGEFDTGKYKQLWTCNGDYLLRYNPETGAFAAFESFQLSDRTVMDFFSPACLDNNKEDIGKEPHVIVDLYEIDEAIAICNLISDGLSPLDEQFVEPLQLIDRCTNVIVMKKYKGDEYFYSSSNGAYIGTSFLINPQIASPEMIINALVHEATHSLILAIDVCRQWMPGPGDPNTQRAIPSHWTGRPLPLRSYLQAQFVWYGLFNFWKHAVNNNIYSQRYAHDRLSYISKGFEKVDASILREYGLANEVIETIGLMQQHVLNHRP